MTLVDLSSSYPLSLNSPLRYPGGKSRLAGFFSDVLDELDMRDVTYVEPFAGGAGAGLTLLLRGRVDRVVINDLDPAVYSFWSSIRNENQEFVRRIRNVPLTLTEWERQRSIYKAADSSDPFRLGFAFFYLNRTNRSGILHAGVIGGKSQTARDRIDARFPREQLVQRVQNVGKLAHRIELTFTDGRKVVQQLAADSNTFFYVDPPYVQAGGSLYLNAFDHRDHAALAATMNDVANERWLLTYDDAPLVRRLYAQRGLFEFELHYSAHRVGRARELLVASDPLRGLIARRAGK